MEAFSITCTTCQARLRVRDSSTIGQILTCPKCGSMVLIEAPAGETTEPAAGAIPESQPKPASPVRPPPRKLPPVPGHSSPVSASAGAPRAGSPPQPVSNLADTVEDLTRYGTFQHADADPDAPVVPQHGPPHAEAGIPPEPGVPELSGESMEPLPPPGWSAESGAARRRWILTALAGALGVVLALILFVWFAGPRTPDMSPSQPAAAISTTAPVSTPSDLARAEDAAAVPGPGPVEQTAPAEPVDAPVGVPAPEAPPTSTLPDSQGVPAPDESMAPTAPESGTAMPTDSRPADSKVAAERGPETAAPPLTPPDFAPAGDSETKKADRLTGSAALSDTLRRLSGLFDPALEPSTEMAVEPETAPPDTPPAATSPGVPPAVEEPARLPRPAPRSVDVADRLNDPILEIQFKATPLQDFLTFVSNLSTIPVTLDPHVLMWRGVTPATPVSVALRETTVARVLDEVLGKLGLGYKLLDQQLLVTNKSLLVAEHRRSARLNLEDLVADDPAKLREIAGFIQELIANGSWDGPDAVGSIKVEGWALEVSHTEAALFEVIVFCEKLRVARGLPPRSSFDPKHFQLASRTARARPALERPVTLNFSRPTLFVRIIDRLARDSGISLLVDWTAVAAAGWNPDAEISWTVVDLPISKALESLLTPMELTYRIVDETTVQITTPQAVSEKAEIEFYRLPRPLDATRDWREQVQPLLQAVSAELWRSGGGQGEVQFDPISQCLMVYLPQPGQLAIERAISMIEP